MDIFKGTQTQLCATIFGTLFAISNGMVLGWTSPMIPYLISENSHIKTTKQEVEWLETALLIGAICGLPTTMYSTQKIGRKRSLLLVAFVELVNWAIVGLSDRILYICIARFMSGMTGNMVFVAAPMYIAEIAQPKIRGCLSSMIYLMMLLGCLTVYIVGSYLPYHTSSIVGCSIVLIQFIVFSFMPESPYYLIWKGDQVEAKRSLKYFRPGMNIEEEFQGIRKAVQSKPSGQWKIKELLSGGNRKALIIVLVLVASQTLCGMNVILMNLHLILKEAGSVYLSESSTAVLFSVIMLVVAFLTSLQVDKYGRKTFLVTSAILTGICLLILAIYFNVKLAGYNTNKFSWIPIVTVMLYAACYKIGLGLIPMVYSAEIFSVNVKAIGMTLSDAMFMTWSVVSLQIYQRLAGPYGMYVPFYFYSFFGFLVASFVVFYVPETRGKTLNEIQEILNGAQSSKVISTDCENTPLDVERVVLSQLSR